jgi:uncharacterized glyoxalase superfamily protein PhnB
MPILNERSLVLLACANPEKVIDFYTEGIGFSITEQIPNYTELTFGNFVLAITDILFMEGFLGINFTLSGTQRHILSLHCDNVDAEIERLVKLGATVMMPPTDQPWKQRVCYLTDPEENIIELAQRIG